MPRWQECQNAALSRFTLDCQAKGSPEPECRWFKDETELTEADLPEGLGLSGDTNQILEFNKVSAELHTGYYHCEARNK